MALLDNRHKLGNILMIAGLALILVAGIPFGWELLQADRLQARLSQLPPARPADARPAQETGTPGVPASREALVQQMSTPEARPAAVASRPAATLTETAMPPSPASTTAAVPPARTATATPAPPRISGTQPVRLVIPDLGIDVPVEPMGWVEVKTASGTDTEWDIPKDAAGHAVSTPLLGEPGNMVISGHNNIYGRVFKNISDAWGGDITTVDKVTKRSSLLDGRLIQLYGADGRRVDYLIDEFLRVQDSGVPLSQRIANAQYIQPGGPTRLTLTTCWPPWSNTHRLIVIAHPVEGGQ